MSGEIRVVRGALAWGALAAVAGSGIAWALRGARGAGSVAVAAGLVLANAGVSALVSAMAGRVSSTGAALVSLPSFAVRMALIFGALVALDGRAFIDEPSFVLSFCASLTIVLVSEARAFRRTPWLAMSFGQKERV